jgi:transcriptional regulator with XRE-family HTH domain
MDALDRIKRNIRILMASRGTNLTQVCRDAGIDPREFISAVANGNPSIRKVERLATTLGIDVSELLAPEAELKQRATCLIPKKGE